MKKLWSGVALACALAMSMTAFAQYRMKQDESMKNNAQPKTMNKEQEQREQRSDEKGEHEARQHAGQHEA